jgi:predicted Ser/Thr protein kinase
LQSGLKIIDRKDSVLGNSTKDFEVVKELGKGSYGTVFLVRLRKDAGKLDGT